MQQLSSTARPDRPSQARISAPLSRRKLGAALLFALASSVAIVAFAAQAPPEPAAGAGEDRSVFTCRISAAKRCSSRDLDGNVWVADFIFTGCQSACPMLTSKMRSLQRHLEERERTRGTQVARSSSSPSRSIPKSTHPTSSPPTPPNGAPIKSAGFFSPARSTEVESRGHEG